MTLYNCFLRLALITALAIGLGFPVSTRAAPLNVGIIGDQTGASNLDAAYTTLQQGVNALKIRTLDVVIHTGDVVESTASEEHMRQRFQQATGILRQLPMPWYLAAGDHDVNPPKFQQDSPDRSRETLFKQLYATLNPKVADHLYYSFDVKGYHFVALYSEEHLDTDPRWGNVFYARIADEQFRWLQQDLDAHKTSTGIIVYLHQPLWYIWSNWSRVHALLRQYPVRAVIAGHFHYNQSQLAIDGIQYWVVGATGGDTKQGRPNSGDLQHVTLLTIDGAHLSFTMLPLAPFTHTTWTPRYAMDRVQALDQVLGSLWSFAAHSPVFVDHNALVTACGSGHAAQLVVQDLGNAIAVPVHVTINVSAGANIQVTQGTFGNGLCQTGVGAFQCQLKPSTAVAVSNTSLVETTKQFLPPCPGRAGACTRAPTLWTGTLGIVGTPPAVGTTIGIEVLLSFEAYSQHYGIAKSSTTTVQGCDG